MSNRDQAISAVVCLVMITIAAIRAQAADFSVALVLVGSALWWLSTLKGDKS